MMNIFNVNLIELLWLLNIEFTKASRVEAGDWTQTKFWLRDNLNSIDLLNRSVNGP